MYSHESSCFNASALGPCYLFLEFIHENSFHLKNKSKAKLDNKVLKEEFVLEQ